MIGSAIHHDVTYDNIFITICLLLQVINLVSYLKLGTRAPIPPEGINQDRSAEGCEKPQG